ncbi:hypothetical protein DE146DRAFT_729497, partial [Phaeosphaeria sp. MPI-PUGE-AT-0046c]
MLGDDGGGAQLNLWSCALYPNITHDFRASTLPHASQEWVLRDDADTSIATSTRVTRFISRCMAAWCDNEESCGKTKCTVDRTTTGGSRDTGESETGDYRLDAQGLDLCLDSICGIQRSSSPDIAGIGVITSIFMQLVLALVLPLILLFCHILIRRMKNKIELPVCSPASDDESFTKRKIARRKIAAWEKSRQGVLATLEDFQRAQCCFAIAIDIASLITLYSGREKVTRVDRDAITLASFAGTLPSLVVFCALLLYKDKGIAYSVYLTCFTWLLSLLTGYLP